MNDKLYTTLLSEPNSNYLTITKHTRKLIKESKAIKHKTAFSLINRTLTNFHIDHLRTNIQNNQLYQTLFTKPNKSLNSIQLSPQLHTQSPSQSTRMQSSNFQKQTSDLYSMKHANFKTKTSMKKEDYNHLISVTKKPKTRNYVNSLYYNPNIRIEPLFEFKTKIQEESRQLYAYSMKTEYFNILKSKANSKVDHLNLDIHNYSTSFELLKLYSKEYDKYAKYLNKIKNKEQDICEELKDKKTQLTNDLERLKKRYKIILHQFHENYNTKFFLMCVKNHSSQVQHFLAEDIKEFTSDQLLIHEIMSFPCNKLIVRNSIATINECNSNIGNANDKIGYVRAMNSKRFGFKRNTINQRNSVKRVSTIMGSIENQNKQLFFNQSKSKNEPIFQSIEEFYAQLTEISDKISLSLNEFNMKRNEVQELRMQREEDLIEFSGNKISNKLLQIEIKEEEESLQQLKTKNDELVNQLNNLPSPKEELGKVKKIIAKMACELNKEFPIQLVMSKQLIQSQLLPLKIIEKIIIQLQDLHNEYKKRDFVEYMKQKQKREKEKKLKITQMVLLQEKMKQIEKNNKVIEKSKKLIIREYKKIDKIRVINEGKSNHNQKQSNLAIDNQLINNL